MKKRIDKIIKKAKCIKNYLQKVNQNYGNLDNLIESLVSYRNNVGDIEEDKIYFIILGDELYSVLERIPLIDYTLDYCKFKYIDRLRRTYVYGIKTPNVTEGIINDVIGKCVDLKIYSLPPIIKGNNNIEDAIFDIQKFKVNDPFLVAELINAGFKPTTKNIEFVQDFD